jgi:recombination protein RecT
MTTEIQSNSVQQHQTNIINFMPEIKDILPSNVSEEAFTRAAAIAMAKNEKLANATPASLVIALSACASNGLIPDNREAALVVRNTKNHNNEYVPTAAYQPMVDGVLKSARLSGQVKTINAKVICENDSFDYWIDQEGEHFTHRPKLGDRGNLVAVYAFALLLNGETVFEAMDKSEIEKTRASSKTPNYGPWVDWYDRMALKSVLHRLTRRLPNASETLQLIESGNEMQWQEDPKDITPPQQDNLVSFMPDEKFNKQFPKWEMKIKQGKGHVKKLIETARDKGFSFSEEQLTQLNLIEVQNNEAA